MKLILLVLIIWSIIAIVFAREAQYKAQIAEGKFMLAEKRMDSKIEDLEYRASVDLLGTLGYEPSYCLEDKEVMCWIKQ